MSSIDAGLDLGNGMTLDAFWGKVETMRDKQTNYNRLLSTVDQVYNEMIDSERELAQWSERMLGAVAVVYGRSSSEYEMAGGSRRSDRRQPRKVESKPLAS